jgi:hypothetical protein
LCHGKQTLYSEGTYQSSPEARLRGAGYLGGVSLPTRQFLRQLSISRIYLYHPPFLLSTPLSMTVHVDDYAVQKPINRNGRTCDWFSVLGLILRRHLSRQRQLERLPNGENNASFLGWSPFQERRPQRVSYVGTT